MFTEPRLREIKKKGWIELICGSMFSGKTEELIRRLRRAQFANLHVEIFKPVIDTRYAEEEIVSHNATSIPSTPVENARSILLMVPEGVEVIGIDEAQFFDESLIEVVQTLALRGTRVIIAGLDMDYLGKPFGPMPALLAISEYVTKVNAICMQCGDLASHSFRKVKNDERVLLGEKESYEPRCRTCFHIGMSN
jgi:thymidine kinase